MPASLTITDYTDGCLSVVCIRCIIHQTRSLSNSRKPAVALVQNGVSQSACLRERVCAMERKSGRPAPEAFGLFMTSTMHAAILLTIAMFGEINLLNRSWE